MGLWCGTLKEQSDISCSRIVIRGNADPSSALLQYYHVELNLPACLNRVLITVAHFSDDAVSRAVSTVMGTLSKGLLPDAHLLLNLAYALDTL